MTEEIVSGHVRTVGYAKMLRKLNADTLTGPAQAYFVKDAIEFAAGFLRPRIPRDSGKSAGRLEMKTGPETSSLSLPAFPLRFAEFGTQLTSGPQLPGSSDRGRSHRKRTAAQWKGGTYRIKPRRFMRQTYTAVRRGMQARVDKAKQMVETEWSK